MKFDCGPTPEQRREAYLKWRENWHRWFAWRPVRLGANDCRWLEYVERKQTFHVGYGGAWWSSEYRAIGEAPPPC